MVIWNSLQSETPDTLATNNGHDCSGFGKYDTGAGFEVLGGYDYQTYSGRDDVLLIAEQEEEVHALFGQLRTTEDLIENAAFAVGARYNETGGVSTTVWNASGRYDFTDYLYAQGIVGTSFLLPTAYQLYAVDPCCSLGNPDLEPEESENLNLALGGSFGNGAMFSSQATAFARKIDNLISTLSFTEAGLDPTQPFRGYDPADYNFRLFGNVEGEVKVEGFELLGQADFGNGFSAQLSYTQSESEQESSGVTSDIQRIPSTYTKLSVGYSPENARFGVNANLLHTGEQISSVTGFGDVNYGDYVVADLSAHYFLDAARNHKLTLRVENLFDEDYITRPNSALVDGTTSGERFFYGNRGVPQTVHVSYSLAF